jgi:cell division septation protein DedD
MVRTEEGVKSFTQGDVDKRNVKIVRGGKPATVSDFREGDRLSATIITTRAPQIMTEQQVQATLAAAPAAAPRSAPPAAAPRPAPTTAASATPSPAAPAASGRTLPKTASSWPLLGFGSVLLLALGLALTVRRRFS